MSVQFILQLLTITCYSGLCSPNEHTWDDSQAKDGAVLNHLSFYYICNVAEAEPDTSLVKAQIQRPSAFPNPSPGVSASITHTWGLLPNTLTVMRQGGVTGSKIIITLFFVECLSPVVTVKTVKLENKYILLSAKMLWGNLRTRTWRRNKTQNNTWKLFEMIKKVKCYRDIKIYYRNWTTAGCFRRDICAAMVQYPQLAGDGDMGYGISQTFKTLMLQHLCQGSSFSSEAFKGCLMTHILQGLHYLITCLIRMKSPRLVFKN